MREASFQAILNSDRNLPKARVLTAATRLLPSALNYSYTEIRTLPSSPDLGPPNGPDFEQVFGMGHW